MPRSIRGIFLFPLTVAVALMVWFFNLTECLKTQAMKLNMRNLNMRSMRGNRMSDQQRQILLISGIVVGAAALLTYPAILLYRRWRDKKNEMMETGEENQTKSFAPSYRGNHKPHHRKVESNGHLHQANA